MYVYIHKSKIQVRQTQIIHIVSIHTMRPLPGDESTMTMKNR